MTSTPAFMLDPARFSPATFLRDFWQKRPVLIRNPWAAWANPLEPDELAGLACEEGVESRLITGPREALRLENGPLPEARFASLGAEPWTLLVQAVDQQVPDVAALIEPFRFVPDWRIDDVMISYATDGGGVGPHYDQYDVFLIQGLGRRRWRVGPHCDASTPTAPHADLRLLADFEAEGDWVLEPGDILYIPPGFAHDGVAVGTDCMTYSIGFRAPSRAELIEGWAIHCAQALGDDDRYADPDLGTPANPLQANPGQITPAALDRLHAMMRAALDDRAAFARWFGSFTSLPKYADTDPAATDWRPDMPADPLAVREALALGVPLVRNPASRFVFIEPESPATERGAERGAEQGIALFVDGQEFLCAEPLAPLARSLCAASAFTLDPALAQAPGAIALLVALIDQGSLTFDEGDDEDDQEEWDD